MKQTPFFPDPKMPLRDMLRGAASLADSTHHALEPAARMLPRALRAELSAALRSLRSTGKRLAAAPISLEDITLAGRFVGGATRERSAAGTCAMVIGHAWRHLGHARDLGERQLLLSETLLAAQLSQLPEDAGTPSDHAAQLVRHVLDARVIGTAPGLFTHLHSEEKLDISLSLLAIAVWLLSDRCDNLEDEDRLVDLAMALVLATRDDALRALPDETAISAYLDRSADHL